VYLIEGVVPAERLKVLVEKSSILDDYSDAEFDFLTTEERRNLEEAIAEEVLKNNMENGICCVAHHEITVSNLELQFEAYIEDDGACIDLMTPYDDRDGKFKNLDNCVTKSW